MRQAVSVDIDGTIALSLASLCAAVNAKCGTQYTMFDLSDAIGWHHVFEDNPDADEWAQTFMSYKHGDRTATIGFYKAMAGDLGGIAAVNMLHKAGVHVTIATLRDPHMYSLTKWWLDHWGVQYDELLCAPNSKFVLAAKGPTVFVDDRLEVAEKLVAQGSTVFLLSRPLEPTVPKDVRLVDTWAPILDYFGVALDATQVPQLAAPLFTATVNNAETVNNVTKSYSEAQGDGSDSKAAGIAVVSQGSGRVLMIQRDNTDKDKKAASRLEFPGGRLNGSESAWAGALREWQEETGNKLPEGEIVATWDNDHGPYRLFVYVIATESEVHLNPDRDDMEVVDPDHPHASQPEVAAWYYPKDLATAKKMVRKELRKFDWSVLTDAVDGKERPKMMYLDLLKGFGDPGSTQEREANGEFGPGTGLSSSAASSGGSMIDAAGGAALFDVAINQGGFSVHAGSGESPGAGYSVGGNVPDLQIPDTASSEEAGQWIAAYSAQNADLLSQDNYVLGGWHNEDTGQIVIEPSQVVSDREDAIALGEAQNQVSIYDNATGETIETGGTGEYTGMSVDPVMATMSLAFDLLIKGFGDPGSTQDREANGQFGEGSGASAESERSASDSKLEEVAIDNFGAAVEMQGQQFVTPNGTILDLPQGDGHDSIVQVTGGSVNTATSRAIDAGFARTSLDIANSSGELGLVMEFSRPLTDPQISAVITAAKDNELGYFAIDVPPITRGGYDRGSAWFPAQVRGLSDSTLLYSDEKESPTLSNIAGMIRDANVAAGGVRKSIASIMLFKTVASNSETNDQGRDEHGQFEVGSGGSHEMAGTTKDPYLKDYPNFGRSYTVTPTDKQIAAAKAFLAAHGKGSCTTYEGGKAAFQATLAQGTAGNGNPNWYSAVRSELNESIDHGAPTNIQAALVSATTSKCAWARTPSASGTSPYAGTTYYPNLTAAATCISVVSENSSFVITQEEADKINAATASGPATFGGEPISDDNVRNADGNIISGDPVLATIDGNGDPIIGPDGERVIQYANDLTDQQVGKFISMSGNSIVPGVGIGMTGGLVNGIMIARGADPSVVLNGDSTMKQNSFANNITYPDQNTTTTQDSHQTNIFMGGGTEKADLQAQGTFRSMPGGYYLMNQATMELAQENGLPTGNAAQAVMWSTQTADEAQAKIMKAAKPNFPDYRPCSSDDEGGEAETDTVSHPYVVVIRSKRGKMMKPRLASSL